MRGVGGRVAVDVDSLVKSLFPPFPRQERAVSESAVLGRSVISKSPRPDNRFEAQESPLPKALGRTWQGIGRAFPPV